MRQVLQLLATRATFVSLAPALALVLWTIPALAAGQTEINYARDGKATMTACLAHLAGKPQTTAMNQAGFETKTNTKKFTVYQKWRRDGLLPKYLVLQLGKKNQGPADRNCTFILSFPDHLFAPTTSPDYQDFMKAMAAALRSGGYKNRGTKKDLVGVERYVWTGPAGIYFAKITEQSGAVSIEMKPQ